MSEPQRRITLPLAQAFVVCREIFEDCRSHEFVLIAPFSGLSMSAFPANFRMSIYAHLTCGHGSYALALQLRDAGDRATWLWDCPKPILLDNPLSQHRFTLHDARITFPEPGRYDLVLLTNGEEVARHALHARLLEPRRT
jgi:hypothetical protein